MSQYIFLNNIQLLNKPIIFLSKVLLLRYNLEKSKSDVKLYLSNAQMPIFKGFLPYLLYAAVTNEKYFNHSIFPPETLRFALFCAFCKTDIRNLLDGSLSPSDTSIPLTPI